jgi:hypothetical protein
MNQIQKLQQTEYTDHYSVFNKDGNKVCDVGAIQDAWLMCALDPTRHYKKVKIILDQVVNVLYENMEPDKQLKSQNILPDNQQEPFVV